MGNNIVGAKVGVINVIKWSKKVNKCDLFDINLNKWLRRTIIICRVGNFKNNNFMFCPATKGRALSINVFDKFLMMEFHTLWM